MNALEGQVVVVSGAASGIGLASARLAATAGAAVALLDVNAEALDQASDELVSSGATEAFVCDVTNEASVAEAFTQVAGSLGPCTGVVVSAGIDIGGALHELDLASWEKVLSVNLTGAFLTLKHGIGQMLAAGRQGSVVCVSSPASKVGFAAGGAGAYSASKGGLSALVRAAAVDYAHKGIRVNAIVPGPTETPLMWANVPLAERAQMREQILREVPLGRMAGPEEPAAAAVWLLSDQARYVTGSELICDGGVLAKGSISV